MSRYIPPSMRNKMTPNQKTEKEIKIVEEGNDKHFPLLGGNVVVPKSALSYGEKAKEWEEKRQALELKEKVDARIAEINAEKERQDNEEFKMFRNRSRRNAVANIVPMPLPQPEVKVTIEEEWTVVGKKPYKPKPKKENKIIEEKFDNYDGLAEDESVWG